MFPIHFCLAFLAKSFAYIVKCGYLVDNLLVYNFDYNILLEYFKFLLLL